MIETKIEAWNVIESKCKKKKMKKKIRNVNI